jgi:hypothetical protein
MVPSHRVRLFPAYQDVGHVPVASAGRRPVMSIHPHPMWLRACGGQCTARGQHVSGRRAQANR